MATQSPPEVGASPRTYGAAWGYILGTGAATLLGAFGASFISQSEGRVALPFWVMTGLYLLLFAFLLTLRLRIDGEGLFQRWLLSHARVSWSQVARVERTGRGYAVQDRDGKDLVLLRFFSRASQKAVADEVVRRARLRPGTAPAQPPVLEYWERKK